MNLIFLIVILILAVIIVFLLILYLKQRFFYFNSMDLTLVTVTPMKIPVGDIELNAKFILPKFVLNENGKPHTYLPLVIFNHGWGQAIDDVLVMQYVQSVAIAGPYAVFLYDCRGHGKTPGKREFSAEIFNDIPKAIDFALDNLDFIDKTRVAFTGVSMGGEIALTKAYPDERIKVVIAACSPNNAKTAFVRKSQTFLQWANKILIRSTGVKGEKMSDEVNRVISPEFILKSERKDLNQRVMLIHAMDDNLVDFEAFKRNREILGIPDENVLIVKKGDHPFFHQELSVLAAVTRFLKQKL